MRRIGIVGGSTLGVAAAVAAMGLLAPRESPDLHAIRVSRAVKKPRRHKPADRSGKKYLLKGVRP